MRPQDFGYVRLEFQVGACLVEHSGERRMFDASPELAEYLTSLLAKPLNMKVSFSNPKEGRGV